MIALLGDVARLIGALIGVAAEQLARALTYNQDGGLWK